MGDKYVSRAAKGLETGIGAGTAGDVMPACFFRKDLIIRMRNYPFRRGSGWGSIHNHVLNLRTSRSHGGERRSAGRVL